MIALLDVVSQKNAFNLIATILSISALLKNPLNRSAQAIFLFLEQLHFIHFLVKILRAIAIDGQHRNHKQEPDDAIRATEKLD